MLNYDNDDYSQGYGQIKETFGALTTDDTLQPFIFDMNIRSSNIGDDIGCSLYVFVIRCQQNPESAQPIKVELNFSENVPPGI